jgi:hypothetical protein
MRTKLRSKVTLLFMTLGLLLAIPAWALADTVIPDGDTTDAIPQGSKDLESVMPGATLSPAVDFYLFCTGNNHLAQGATDTITFQPVGSGGGASTIAKVGGGATTGATLGATNGSVTAPSDWAPTGKSCSQAAR